MPGFLFYYGEYNLIPSAGIKWGAIFYNKAQDCYRFPKPKTEFP